MAEAAANKATVQEEGKAGNSDYLTLKVMRTDSSIVQFKMKKQAHLKKLMIAYCAASDSHIGAVRFLFDGTPIKETDTPLSLGMDDGDIIEVYEQQTGGVAYL